MPSAEGSAKDLFQTKFPVVCFEWTDQGSATYFCPYVLVRLEQGSSVSRVADTAEHERTHPTFSQLCDPNTSQQRIEKVSTNGNIVLVIMLGKRNIPS